MARKKVLIVFYSRNGHTKMVMESLAKELKCDMEELMDYKNRKGIIGYLRCGYEASKMKLPEIKPVKYNPHDYDIVIIGTPVWASNMSSPVRTYITQNKESFNNIAVISTALGTGYEKIINNVEKLYGKKPVSSLGITRKEIGSGEWRAKVSNLIKSMGI